MEFELEELNDELEELNIELRNIKDINLLGKEITHKKFGNGKVVHQNGYNVTIQFNSEEKMPDIEILADRLQEIEWE